MADLPGAQARPDRQQEMLEVKERMSHVRHKILVLSGKGGVGKSTIAINLSVTLAMSGKKVGLLDIDIHGPSVPKLLNLEGFPVKAEGNIITPITMAWGLKVISIGFFLPTENDAVIWRGPLKYHMIKQFIKDVEWGDLDFLIIDSPPGTGDEPLSVAQLLEDTTGAIIVTTPQDLSLTDVRKCITFCRKLNIKILGVIENMSGFVCPKCGAVTNIFKTGGGESMAAEMGVPFLGRIPLDPKIVESSDSGKPYILQFSNSNTADAFKEAVAPIIELAEEEPEKKE